MSSEWIVTTLGEVCTSQNGAIQTGPFGSQLHASDYVETGIPVVMPSNIGPDGGISEDGIARIRQEDADRLSQHKLQIGDVVFSRRGDVTRNALIEPHQVGWLCGTGCLKVRLGNEAKADAKFISYCLRLPETKEWLIRHAVGATMPNLNTSILSAVPIQIPPITEQKKITNFLRALDDRINLLREINATLEAIAQTLFKSWFVDFDPVHANAGTQAPSLPPEIQALFPATFTDSPQGPIPEGWEFGTIADLGEVICGKTPATSEPLNYGRDVPFITIPDMHGKLVVTDTARSLSKMGANTQTKKFLRSGSICVSCIATPGLVVRVTEPSQTNQQINSVVPLPKWGDSYPLFALQRVGELVRAEGSGGSVFHNLNKSGFEKIPMLLPDVSIVAAFNAVAESLVAKITENQKTTQSLAQLRDTLLPRLISGQLRLPEAEQAIAAITD